MYCITFNFSLPKCSGRNWWGFYCHERGIYNLCILHRQMHRTSRHLFYGGKEKEQSGTIYFQHQFLWFESKFKVTYDTYVLHNDYFFSLTVLCGNNSFSGGSYRCGTVWISMAKLCCSIYFTRSPLLVPFWKVLFGIIFKETQI